MTKECAPYSRDWDPPAGCTCLYPMGVWERPLSTDPACISYCTTGNAWYAEYLRLCFEAPGTKNYNDPRCAELEEHIYRLDGERMTACGCHALPVQPEPPKPSTGNRHRSKPAAP